MRHPEQRDDEIFLGNYTPEDRKAIGWKLLRCGEFAYRTDGSPYPYQEEHAVKPLFVRRSEVQAAYDVNQSPDLKAMLDAGSIIF